jgi:hypothetical protein
VNHVAVERAGMSERNVPGKLSLRRFVVDVCDRTQSMSPMGSDHPTLPDVLPAA